MRTATVKAFAKINLGLKILGRRNDGFHELRTIYQTVSLHDSLEVSLTRRARQDITLSATGLSVPAGPENLAVRAASAMRAAAKIADAIEIRLLKRIPTGGGLGGGSSDAAAVIRALDSLTGHRLARGEVFEIAAKLGSDVPFFLFGGRAIGVGRGEEVYPLPDGAAYACLLAVPQEGMSTAEAYRALRAKPWPPRLASRRQRPPSAPVAQPTIEIFSAALSAEPAFWTTGNDFEDILFKKFPQLAAAKRILLRRGAQWAGLTGSGSAVFGLFRSGTEFSLAQQELKDLTMRVYRTRTVARRQYAQGLRLS